jgi:hypothetical protein
MYGETISGVTILRAFGASSKFLRDMLRCVDTVRRSFPYWNGLLILPPIECQSFLLDVGR